MATKQGDTALLNEPIAKDQGKAWVEQAKKLFPRMARITVSPEWVSVIDFENRFPSAIEAAMSGGV